MKNQIFNVVRSVFVIFAIFFQGVSAPRSPEIFSALQERVNKLFEKKDTSESPKKDPIVNRVVNYVKEHKKTAYATLGSCLLVSAAVIGYVYKIYDAEILKKENLDSLVKKGSKLLFGENESQEDNGFCEEKNSESKATTLCDVPSINELVSKRTEEIKEKTVDLFFQFAKNAGVEEETIKKASQALNEHLSGIAKNWKESYDLYDDEIIYADDFSFIKPSLDIKDETIENIKQFIRETIAKNKNNNLRMKSEDFSSGCDDARELLAEAANLALEKIGLIDEIPQKQESEVSTQQEKSEVQPEQSEQPEDKNN